MEKANPETVFRQKAPKIMLDLIKDFSLTVEEAAAIVGNAGHECLGFTKMQEIAPTVPGSRGGYGWFQWTGPRRREFENYCKINNLFIDSDQANYQFLCYELRGPERRAIPALKKAVGLKAKVEAFEETFERAGVKAYPSRMRWANIALDAYGKKPEVEPPVLSPPANTVTVPGTVPKPVEKTGMPIAAWIIAAVIAAFSAFGVWLTNGGN